jgi:hypothetical protein
MAAPRTSISSSRQYTYARSRASSIRSGRGSPRSLTIPRFNHRQVPYAVFAHGEKSFTHAGIRRDGNDLGRHSAGLRF